MHERSCWFISYIHLNGNPSSSTPQCNLPIHGQACAKNPPEKDTQLLWAPPWKVQPPCLKACSASCHLPNPQASQEHSFPLTLNPLHLLQLLTKQVSVYPTPRDLLIHSPGPTCQIGNNPYTPEAQFTNSQVAHIIYQKNMTKLSYLWTKVAVDWEAMHRLP